VPNVIQLEGFHPLKHALRFGADVLDVMTSDPERLAQLVAELAPDLAPLHARTVAEAELAPHARATGVMALARRPDFDLAVALADPAPVILLEDPRRLGNLGACVRVAAAAGAAALLTTGASDPWHPDAVRGAAGLHYALPVARVDELPHSGRPLVAVDPGGEPGPVPPGAVLAFGSERHGLSDALLAAADQRLRIPMRPGVSSLNLATAVAAVLYASCGVGNAPPSISSMR
jgi:TrmH family RNA methyltransferase